MDLTQCKCALPRRWNVQSPITWLAPIGVTLADVVQQVRPTP